MELTKKFKVEKPIQDRIEHTYEKTNQARLCILRADLKMNDTQKVHINSALQWLQSIIDDLKYDTSIES